MKKLAFLLIVLVLVAAIVLPACAQPAPAPAPAGETGAAGATGPAGTPAPMTHQWRAASVEGLGEPTLTVLADVVAEIRAKSEGQLVIQIFPGGALGFTYEDMLRVMQQDLVEVTHFTQPNLAGDFPNADITNLPFLSPTTEDIPKIIEALDAMWDEELPKWHAKRLATWSTPPQTLTTKKKVATVEDWAGLKVRAWSKMYVDICNEMGATPVSVPYAEAYAATAAGVIDAHAWSPPSVYDHKLWELGLAYVNLWAPTFSGNIFVVNTTAFNELSPELQKLLVDTFDKYESDLWEKDFWVAQESLALLEAEGMELVIPSPEEKAKIAGRLAYLWDNWLERANPDGLKWINIALAAAGSPPYK